jgi:REP element-mobilizing transposase RayT
MSDPRIADLVATAVLEGRERSYYDLSAWCVMPNHVHMLVLPRTALPRTMHWLKGSTARLANQILGRTGESFWQDESYDHWARDARERGAIATYIERNPVAAGLAEAVDKYRWSSARR